MPRPALARNALMEAARAELISNGRVDDLSTVVNRAGVSTGAVYHHFGSKVALIASVYQAFFDGSERAISTADRHGGTWIERVHRRCVAIVTYYFDDPLTPVMLSNSVDHAAIAELELAYLARVVAGVVQILRDGKRSGELAADVDVDLVAEYLTGGLRRGLAVLIERDPRPAVEAAGEQLWQLVATTIGLR